jgi:phage virion morphogenesis protein
MSGVTMSASIDDRELQRQVAEMIRRGGDLRPALEEIGDMLVSETVGRFMRDEDPEGHPWKPSRRAEEEGGQTLSDSGILRNSITKEVSAASVEVGTPEIYGAIHQVGGTITAKDGPYLIFQAGDRWVCVRQVEIPARQFLGITDRDTSEAIEIVKRHLGLC